MVAGSAVNRSYGRGGSSLVVLATNANVCVCGVLGIREFGVKAALNREGDRPPLRPFDSG